MPTTLCSALFLTAPSLAATRVRMVLDHFGVPYDTAGPTGAPNNLADYPLIVLAGMPDAPTLARLRDALRAGTGIACFDGRAAAGLLGAPVNAPARWEGVTIAGAAHPITALHPSGQPFVFDQPVDGIPAAGEMLLGGPPGAFLGACTVERGRLVTWASTDWMDTRWFGPFMGLDDLFWRGLVWAARKPFALRGLPPLVTMRVDDVAGRGGLWGETPLYWVDGCARLGWKPWLGLFLYNLEPQSIQQLQAAVAQGEASVFPHALGRPDRAGTGEWYYHPDALPLRSDNYDEFLFFDHQHGRPWSDAEAARGLTAAGDWLVAHALPVSRVALPHWYEMGSNTARHVFERWGCDLIGKPQPADQPLAQGVPWLPLGPFRAMEPPGECHPFTSGGRGGKAVYYADFLTVAGCRFFNSLTEVRDDAGYEWAPDPDVTATVARGVRQLRRALDSMALAQLFTHETDFIYKIPPAAWHEMMAGITGAVAGYHPRFVTLDEGMQIVRATKTSRLERVTINAGGVAVATFSGQADCPTTLWWFAGDALDGSLVDVPVLSGGLQQVTLAVGR